MTMKEKKEIAGFGAILVIGLPALLFAAQLIAA